MLGTETETLGSIARLATAAIPGSALPTTRVLSNRGHWVAPASPAHQASGVRANVVETLLSLMTFVGNQARAAGSAQRPGRRLCPGVTGTAPSRPGGSHSPRARLPADVGPLVRGPRRCARGTLPHSHEVQTEGPGPGKGLGVLQTRVWGEGPGLRARRRPWARDPLTHEWAPRPGSSAGSQNGFSAQRYPV